ncbi:MAG: polyprenyl synthetase family protein [Chitinophagales bacterium]|nr:polyprenyl synthetase family protein [Chitinophagales bacterium]
MINRRTVAELEALFNSSLNKQSFSGYPKELYDPFNYILQLTGKRIRPIMLLMACELFGKAAEEAISQAIAIELFHNFTLIHDDIMDRAPLRRGHSTVHQKYTETSALLSGDAMLVYAYRYLVNVNSSQLALVISLFNECAIKVCEGQQMDMNFESAQVIKAEEYLRMIKLKTATLLASSLKLGAIIGNALLADADHLYNFGLELGIAFQLRDDWLDSFGETQKVGKQKGGDIIQNKKTFLFVESLNIADEHTRQSLLQLYSEQQRNSEEKIKAVLSIFYDLNIEKTTEKKMQNHFEAALQHLQFVNIGDNEKKYLNGLAHDLIRRDK